MQLLVEKSIKFEWISLLDLAIEVISKFGERNFIKAVETEARFKRLSTTLVERPYR